MLPMHINQHTILVPLQFGFRLKHPTQHQLLRVLDFLSEKKSLSAPTFLDMAKAFAKVWHNGLLYKLIQHGFPAWLIHLIFSYLCNSSFRVRINNIISDIFLILSGIFQGSVLGPLLLILFFNDIQRFLHTYLAFYEAALYGSHSNLCICTPPIFTIQVTTTLLKLFIDWCNLWRIRINESKTTAVPSIILPSHGLIPQST